MSCDVPVGFCFIVGFVGYPGTVYPFKGGGSCDLDVCGLHGDHVMGVISSRGESIAGWGSGP